MSFEEYLKLQEKLIGEITPEIRQTLKGSYKAWQLSLNDRQFLEPISNIKESFPDAIYFDAIQTVFKPLDIEIDELTVLILPAFEPEYQIKFLRDSVEKTTLKQQLWSQKGKPESIDIERTTLALAHRQKIEFVEDVKQHIAQAQEAKATIGNLDGTRHYFIYRDHESIKTAYKNAEKGDDTKIEMLLKKLDLLINN